MSHPSEITDANFENDVLKSEKPVLIDFWAPWCGPCRQLSPEVEKAAEALGDEVIVGKMNIDDNMNTAMELGVTSIPTLALFRDGKLLWRSTGYRPAAGLVREVQQALA